MGIPRTCERDLWSRSFSLFKANTWLSTKSHLLTAIISALPSLITCSAIIKSCLSAIKVPSIKSTVTCENCIARRVSAIESCSSFSLIRERRRRPAVSNNLNRSPFQSKSTEIVSRVTPGSGPVMTRFSFKRLFKRVDFPTFGLPTNAICNGSGFCSKLSFA